MAIDKEASYYDTGGIETITFIEAKLTPDMFTGFLLGNCLKYASRLVHKGVAQRDAQKLAVYAGLLVKALDKPMRI